MLEKLILAAAITFSVNFFLGVTSQNQTDSSLYLGKNVTETVSLLNQQ